jgi:hypothetical protein
MRDTEDLVNRLRDAQQQLLLAVRCVNRADVGGQADPEAIAALAAALEHARDARDAIDLLRRRIEFFHQLRRIEQNVSSDGTSRRMIDIVKLGVDGGFQIEDVRKVVDETIARSAGPPPG